MSQKSITSFFKKTPKKDTADKFSVESPTEIVTDGIKKEKNSPKRQRINSDGSKTKAPNKDLQHEQSPKETKTNGIKKEKKTSKRSRLDSSDGESPSSKKDDQLQKKNKVKRQRIESSGSEEESHPKSEEKSPVVKMEIDKSPKKSPSESKLKTPTNKATIKTAKNKTPAKKKDTKSEKENTRKKSNSLSPTNISKLESPKDDTKKADANSLKSENGDVEIKKENKNQSAKKVPAAEYDPTKTKYHPIDDACWSKDEPVPYLALAKTLEAIEATSARLKIVDILSNYMRSVIALTPADLLPSVYMCLNQLAPAYHGIQLGIAETYLMKAIGQCTGRSLAQMKAAAAKCGDLGAVAEQARATQRTMFSPPPLHVRKVFAALKDIAGMTGQSSVNKKIGKIQSLYVACRHSEARYLIRCLEGKLRIGLAEQSVLQALAQAAATTPPDPAGVKVLDASKGLTPDQFKARVDEHALTIKTTYCECPNYDLMVPVLLEHGVAALPRHCRLAPGVPLKPMLAHPTKGVHEVFNRFENEEFTCEWKYDGERAQIHVPSAAGDGDADAADLANAAIFSRNQENNTSKYPDILRRLPSLLKPSVRSCVLDCEAVAYDTEHCQILPFQVLSTRKRKDAAESEIKVQVCVFVFDLLFLNGAPLVREPLARRRQLLREHFLEVPGQWQFATSKDCTTMEEVQQFLDEAVKGSCEGLMVKMLNGENARYDIARRSHNWLKLKKDYLEGVGDTLDVVVIGAYYGKGKRAGAFGGFLLACYDPDAEEYQSLCKIGTGFSDEDLQTLSKALEEHVIDGPRSYYRYDSAHEPDVWVRPGCVWEVRCADLSLSPAHRAAIGLVDPDKGISLRFPRFVRARDDKGPEQATAAQQVAALYLAQDQVRNQLSKPKPSDDFY